MLTFKVFSKRRLSLYFFYLYNIFCIYQYISINVSKFAQLLQMNIFLFELKKIDLYQYIKIFSA